MHIQRKERILALDPGSRQTGVAFFDPKVGFAIPLDTLQHSSSEECIRFILQILQERPVERLLVGMPYLPDGSKGEQARKTEQFIQMLQNTLSIPIEAFDERYSSFSTQSDPHAGAACALLSCWLEKEY
ncbi:Holliday junction resolvase RuvX [Candidatus Peregrinibacteria bacterium CG10_big_fil_rev_8_21_14_0_10_49_16]|nr:MAG: Holliday junction resolvase RuvX [Candidatus Peregrinibacteria bacterium CG22_combo_CG10-13_8_21_14_all_49_11]PIR51913.1 MAG: Holliday junction resolvase RuvX [Candidatus Peregrinibacteria bacterium CG10_big_fil_rev_8_21_14_0_10_49_16]